MMMKMKMRSFPVEIFLIIREYIGNENDYRMFMNCNKEIFQSIKYQTVYFNIKIYVSENDKNIEETFKNFLLLTNTRVKDKSKQIGLYLYDVTSEFLNLSSHMFHQIHYLNITRITNELDFNLFNNIYHVELNDLLGITSINSGFENVRILTISRANNLKTIDFSRASVNLREISLFNCPKISILKGINNLRCFEIDDTLTTPSGFELIPNIPYERISLRFKDLPLEMFRHCDLSHLQSLSLFDIRLLENDDLSVFKNIPHLSLTTCVMKVDVNKYPILPVFYGSSLELTRFNLQSWISSECFPNVKRIRLIECINLDPQLSFLSHVRRISFYKIDQLTHFPSLPQCTHLDLSSVYHLKIIASQPKLRELTVTSCLELSDYESDGQLLNRVIINACPEFQSLKTFRNTCELIFRGNDPIDLSGLNYSNSLYLNRIIRMFVNIYSTSFDCSDVSDLDLLEMSVTGEIQELRNFHDIHTVRINICFAKVNELSYLHNIQVLQFTRVKHLTSLHHLENIDKIMLCAFPADFQFDGLKGCRVVYSRGNKRLEEQAELYGRGERDVSLFDSNYLEMFGSIEEFYIVHEDIGPDWHKLKEHHCIRLW